jgi:glycosyltransferase involved in cell wall biosynthesis
MYRGKRIAVVVPAFNVADHIVAVLDGLPDYIDDIVVVDDASSDETSRLVRELNSSRVHLICHGTNQGVGGAMASGLRLAMDRGADIIVKMDGDGQMDPEYLPALMDPIAIEGIQYTKGNRFLLDGQLRRMPLLRLGGNFGLTFLTKLASGYWHVFDPVNGFVAIEAATLRRMPLQRIARRYFFETDMLIHLNVLRARVRDIPVPVRYGNERSSMRLSTVLLTFPLFLVRGFFHRLYERYILREFSAVAVFWILGLALLAWGTGFGAYTWAHSILTGRVATTGTVMLSVLPFILGFQLALQAILIEIQDQARWQ